MRSEPPGSKVRILLVDDNIDHVQLALRAFRGRPWTIESVRLGAEAIEKLSGSTYDVVLLDYRLPDLTGLEVLERVRKLDADIAVFLMSSQGSEEVAMKALERGATGYVVKNSDFGTRLVYEVQEWLFDRDG